MTTQTKTCRLKTQFNKEKPMTDEIKTDESPAVATDIPDLADIDDRMWKKSDIERYLGYGTTTVDRLVCKKGFPKPIRVERSGHPRWFQNDVRDWAKRQARIDLHAEAKKRKAS